MQRRLATQATSVGVNGDFLRGRRRATERHPPERRRARITAEPVSFQRRDNARRAPRRTQGELSRDLARIGSAPGDQLPQQGSGDERRLALHVRLGSVDPTCCWSLRCRARFCSPRHPQHRPCRSGDVHDAGQLGPDRARHGRSGRAWHRRREASGRGAARDRRDGAADPPAGLVGRVRCDRRRSGSRARRSARLPVERRVHDLAARAPRAANGRRAARGRGDHPPDDRRSSARPLGRDDELRARAGARPLRRRSWNGARQRRLVDAGVRGSGAELAVGRKGAGRLDRAHAAVLRGVRAAAARGGCVAQRRRCRRDAEAVLQDRASLHPHGDAHRAGRHDRVAGVR